ncbi:hypothetical protein IFJ82_06335 [Novacetimonas hansenii]|uniref:hypothetical protein n=1 Tax=Novacetimonas hansenii TaxID=436 RepID=UPI0017852296|nr:hypothetical protein [Novacetimonas hansenii]MBL7238317.1 hypothetical protein [Novacetimonas hansenii]QOF96190.1 hypothetical protein IFJ82_06335 [Novacetimonas hansenii]
MLAALVAIEQQGVDEEEVREICSLLERSAMTLLPTEVETRVRSVATEAAATMLEKKAMCLPLEDIESMDEALFTHGNDQERAAIAVQSAMWTFTRSVDSDLEAITTLDDLDEFERSVLALMERRGFPADTVKRDIRWRREAAPIGPDGDAMPAAMSSDDGCCGATRSVKSETMTADFRGLSRARSLDTTGQSPRAARTFHVMAMSIVFPWEWDALTRDGAARRAIVYSEGDRRRPHHARYARGTRAGNGKGIVNADSSSYRWIPVLFLQHGGKRTAPYPC